MMKKKHLITMVILAMVVSLTIVSCTEEADLPVIESLEAGPERVIRSGSCQIVCIASASDGIELSYEWWASGGEIVGSGATVTWIAPDSEGTYDIQVTVSDGLGNRITRQITVIVEACQPPVIESLQAESSRVFPSDSIYIVCTAASPDGNELSYEWWASGGEVEGEGATATWTAPDFEGVYNIKVTVRDGRGGETEEYVTVVVEANQPPVVNSLTTSVDWTFPGRSLQVICEAEDPDDHVLTYDWSVSGGHIYGAGPEVTWTAPEEIGTYAITVVVDDGYGGSATTTLQVDVMSDQPPVIEALIITADHPYLVALGSRYRVAYEYEYTIECIAAHPDGYELDYEWSCNGGEIAEVSEDGSTITWVAPDAYANIIVTVIVSDVAGNKSEESMNLTVVSRSACLG